MTQAGTLGLGPGNPIYDDMEAYTPGGANSAAVLAFLSGWTTRLHQGGYLSGVYVSDDSGVRDLVAQSGTGYTEPDELWMANWNGVQSTADANVPSNDWASHQRLHQYDGGHDESYAKVTLNIDGDYVDAATASPGSATTTFPGSGATATAPPVPALTVSPAPDGSVALTPSWNGGPAVSAWQILSGATPSGMAATTGSLGAGADPIVVHTAPPYFAARALGAAGQTLGTSPAVATPAHLTIAGSTAFVPPSGFGGVPVGCFSAAACHVAATITMGATTLLHTGNERVPVGGGLVLFQLPASARRLVRRAARGRGHRDHGARRHRAHRHAADQPGGVHDERAQPGAPGGRLTVGARHRPHRLRLQRLGRRDPHRLPFGHTVPRAADLDQRPHRPRPLRG